MAFPVIAVFCQPISADGSGSVPITEQTQRLAALAQLGSERLVLLQAHRKACLLQQCKAASGFEARLYDVTHLILSKGPRQ